MVSDYTLSAEYFKGKKVDPVTVEDFYDSEVENTTTPKFANASYRECFQTNFSKAEGYTFSCVEHHYNFGVKTLVFTFLPSVYTVSAFMGPDKAPLVGLLFSVLYGLFWVSLDIAEAWGSSVTMSVTGNLIFWQGWSLWGVSLLSSRYTFGNGNVCENGSVVLYLLGVFLGFPIIGILNIPGVMRDGDTPWVIGRYLLWLPAGMMAVGWFLSSYKFQSLKSFITDLLFFSILYTLSPLLFLMTKLMTVIRPENEFIINQSKVMSMGEVILESTPQTCLQLFIILTTINTKPTFNQWFSIATSILAITISLLDKYISSLSSDYSLKEKILTALRVSMIFLTNALFRILSLVVMIVLDRNMSVAIIAGSIGILIVSMLALFLGCCYTIKDDEGLFFDLWFLNWLTIVNLENTPTARFYRTVGFYCNLSLNLIMLVTVFIWSMTGDWSHLKICQEGNIQYLHQTLCITIGCGMTSLLLDLVFKFFGWKSVFNEGWQSFNEIAF